MRTISRFIVALLLLTTIFLISSSQGWAQDASSVISEKGGKFHIGLSVLVGNTVLKSGMYKVQQVMEGGDHFIVFRIIRMNPYKNQMGNERLGEEVARVKCNIEPVDRRWKHTKVTISRNHFGQRVVAAVQIKGENVLHKI